MIGVEVGADVGVDAGWLAAGRLDLLRFAGQPVHVGGRPAQIRDHTCEARHLVADDLDLANNRIFRAALNDAPLVFGDRAKSTAAKAAAHHIDRKADHVVGRNLRITVLRVRHAGIGQIEDVVHLFGGERDRRRVQPDITQAVALHQCARVARVGLQVQHAIGVRVEHRILADFFERGQAYHTVGALLGDRLQALGLADKADWGGVFFI